MRVAFVVGTTSGGTGRHVQMLAAGCAARGVAVSVFGPAQTGRDFAFDATSAVAFVPVEIADRPRPLQDSRGVFRLRRAVRASAADVVHAHGMRAGALTAIASAGMRARPRLVVTVHNAPVAGGATGAIYRVLELIVARRADSVLCVSADLEERMRAAGARRIGHAIVPPPAMAPDVSATAPSTGMSGAIAREVPVVLAVGRLATQKGFGVLLRAAARWRDLRPVPLLMIVGEGPLAAELKDQAAALGVTADFAGQRTDIQALLAAADVFVLPSMWEGQALILQEAIRAGAPIVATRAGGTPAITGEDAAVLIPAGDPAPLADAVRRVLTDPALAGRLRKAALDRAGQLPGPDAAVSAALAEYRHLAE
jgi:glycosyltransferase involved in cell wall biosynthesis